MLPEDVEVDLEELLELEPVLDLELEELDPVLVLDLELEVPDPLLPLDVVPLLDEPVVVLDLELEALEPLLLPLDVAPLLVEPVPVVLVFVEELEPVVAVPVLVVPDDLLAVPLEPELLPLFGALEAVDLLVPALFTVKVPVPLDVVGAFVVVLFENWLG